MTNLEDTIDLIIGDESLEVFRDGNVFYVDGKPVKVNKKSFLIDCNVQPVSGRELLMVPELDRHKEQYSIYVNGSPLETNDRIKRCEKYFQVQSLQNWGNHQEAKMMLIDGGDFSND